jgi:hypothetical protein
MNKIIIPQGEVFGRLTVIEEAEKQHGRIAYLCQCECGNQVIVSANKLRKGHTQSCGCLKKERTSEAKKTHGMQHTTEYNTWIGMKTRCFNPKNQDFKNYGGRGIIVCDEWKDSFETFYTDMGAKPEGYSIDRIDVDGNYEPSNCRWATRSEQQRNRTDNHLLTYKEETKTMIEWSDELKIKYSVLKDRITRYQWSVERAFSQPVRPRT